MRVSRRVDEVKDARARLTVIAKSLLVEHTRGALLRYIGNPNAAYAYPFGLKTQV